MAAEIQVEPSCNATGLPSQFEIGRLQFRRIATALLTFCLICLGSPQVDASVLQENTLRPSQPATRQAIEPAKPVVRFNAQNGAQKEADPTKTAQQDQDPARVNPTQVQTIPASLKQPVGQKAVAVTNEPDEIDAAGKKDGAAELSEFDQEAAFGYMKEICDIGPRISASRGMEKQQKYIKQHFDAIGGQYIWQDFQAKSPFTGNQVDLRNLMVRWHPERTKRILICCHHDTRPFADADPKNARAKFIGANDGASGVGLLCELGKHIGAMEGQYGVDFIFFDGEEFVIVRQRDPMFLGSTYFAHSYANGKIPWRYENAILVDMVADKELQLFMEGNSLKFAKALTQEIWSVANDIGVKEFLPQGNERFIRDDHLPLNEIAKIPTCDIIDFDFPNPQAGNVFWHTQEDKIKNCSAESLGKVGSVVLAWIRKQQKKP